MDIATASCLVSWDHSITLTNPSSYINIKNQMYTNDKMSLT